jgi:hypothetical protein
MKFMHHRSYRCGIQSVVAAAAALALAAAQAPPPAPAEDDDLAAADYVLFEIELLQIDIEVAANHAITFNGEDLEFHAGGELDAPNIVIGERAELDIGDDTWPLDRPRGDGIEGAGDEEGGSPFTILSAPRIACRYGESAMLAVGKQIHYLEHDAEGHLVLRTEEEMFEGVRITIEPEELRPEGVAVKRLRVHFGLLSGRDELEGIPLDVGRPIISSVGITGSFTLPAGHVAVVPMPTWDQNLDPVLVVIRAKHVRADD